MDTNAPDLAELKARLVEQLEILAEKLMGPPNPETRHSREWRWGSNGGRALVMRGPKRGAFHDHKGGTRGDVLEFIRFARSSGFSETVKWAAEWIGLDGAAPLCRVDPAALTERSRKRAQAAAEASADEAKRTAHAQAIWDAARAVDGTPAEAYLAKTRGISAPGCGWPDAVRWHPRSRALTVAATTVDGAVQAVQRVHLTSGGEKIGAVEVKARGLPNVKANNGVVGGAVVRLPGDPAGPLLLAEGPETGLSVWVATGYETHIVLGADGFAKCVARAGRHVVLCHDDDPRFSRTHHTVQKAVDALRRDGVDAVVAWPWPERRGDKSDFNDVLRAGGIDAVRARLAAALNPSAPSGSKRVPIAAGRQLVDEAVARFFAAFEAQGRKRNLKAGMQLVHAIRADVGTGKSRAARRHAAHMLARMRARGDKRTGVLGVPTHRLGEEQAAEFETLPAARAAGLTAAIWRGRDAEDPEAPGETMCRTPDLAREAREAGASVERACCRRNLENGATADCPFLAVCGYQHQRVVRPDLLIIPHDLLFTEKPDAIGDVAFLIVDESAWQDGLEGITGRPITLPLDNFLQPDFISDDPAGTARLRHLRRLTFDALVSATDGPLTREAVDVVGITAAMAAEARRLEQKRWTDPGMRPALAGDERRKAAPMIAERNRTIRRMDLFWRAVEALAADGGPQASGWAELDREQDGRHVRMLRLKGRKPVGKGWHVPTLHLDANLNTDLLRYHWPAVELTADIAVEAPYQRVTQIADDLTFSKTRFLSDKDTGETEKKRRAKNLRDLHALLAAIGRSRAPGRVLVVCQKEVEEALLARGWLPSNLEFAHHNAISGRDEWGPRPNRPGVVTLVIVGRTAPSPNEVKRRAEALTGAAVPPVTGWFPGTCVSRRLTDGSRLEAVADRHPNSVAEAIRWTICEGELVQISGRARGGNRTEENPVDMLVLTNVPLSIPIDATVRIDDLNPTPSDLMLAAGGIAFTNSTDAATAYHDLWSSPAAAKMAQNRARSVTNPYNDYIYGNVTHLLRWIYQLPGAGKRPAEAWVDVSMHPDPAAALAAKLGQLAWCRPADVTGEAAPAP